MYLTFLRVVLLILNIVAKIKDVFAFRDFEGWKEKNFTAILPVLSLDRYLGSPSVTQMKTLYIVRHAKSSWDDAELSDFERPLNERGKADAPKMAKRLKEKDFHPDLVLSSPAKRALSTARRICKVIGFKKENIKTERRLYHADDEMMLSVLRETKAKVDTVMMVGHNPGLTDFVNSIVNEEIDIDNVPTCGVVGFSFDTDEWNKINWGTGKFLFFDYPKKNED